VQSRFLQVPWRDLVYSLGEHFTEEELRRILATSRKTTARKRNLINFYLRDLSWTAPGSRVADNVLLEALRHCI
jgi:type IV secretory pathway TrbF-like protein